MRIVCGMPGFVDSPGGRRIRRLRPDWDLVEAPGDRWREALAEADVAVPVGARVGAEELSGSSLRLVQQFGVGLDTVDVDACRAAGVQVARVPSTVSANAVSVAEIAVALVLDVARRIDAAREGIRTGDAQRPPRTLAGRRVLLVGLGGLGSAIAARLAAFDVTVVATREHPEQGGAPGVAEVHGADALDDLLPTVDGVVCCSTPSSDGPMFTADRFARFAEGAFLVNVSRGIAVDEAALLAALDEGRLGGAGLDVVVHEPARADDPLVANPRVVVTPHIGGATLENLITTAEALVDNVDRLERGDPLRWTA